MSQAPLRILGIDPGSRITGYGLIEITGSGPVCLSFDAIRLNEATLPGRLRQLFNTLQSVVETYRPQEVGIEKVFVHKNVDSAIKLGQARGVAIAAVATKDLALAEYAPREIKLAVVGTGAADKNQVAQMVKAMLKLSTMPPIDATDALAVALCHYHARLSRVTNQRKDSWRNYDRQVKRKTD